MAEMPFGGLVGRAEVQEGGNDSHYFVQAFARHRLSAEQRIVERIELGLRPVEQDRCMSERQILTVSQLRDWEADNIGMGDLYDRLCDAEDAINEAQARYDSMGPSE